MGGNPFYREGTFPVPPQIRNGVSVIGSRRVKLYAPCAHGGRGHVQRRICFVNHEAVILVDVLEKNHAPKRYRVTWCRCLRRVATQDINPDTT